MVPSTEMKTNLKTQEKELSDDISSLNKKVHFIPCARVADVNIMCRPVQVPGEAV